MPRSADIYVQFVLMLLHRPGDGSPHGWAHGNALTGPSCINTRPDAHTHTLRDSFKQLLEFLHYTFTSFTVRLLVHCFVLGLHSQPAVRTSAALNSS